MINVGITGGIGTGKTTVCNAFMQLGIPVFNADIQAKVLMESDLQIRAELINLLGEDIYSGMEINKQRLASIIFSNQELRNQVNTIVHPRVAKHYIKWSDRYNDYLYVIHVYCVIHPI